jgi:hypothetical protein
MTPAPVCMYVQYLSPDLAAARAPGRWMEHSTAPQQADPACAAAAAAADRGADAGEGKEVQQPHCRIIRLRPPVRRGESLTKMVVVCGMKQQQKTRPWNDDLDVCITGCVTSLMLSVEQ